VTLVPTSSVESIFHSELQPAFTVFLEWLIWIDKYHHYYTRVVVKPDSSSSMAVVRIFTRFSRSLGAKTSTGLWL
jgi:hypothetical protein